ncbi:hypothetical protein ACWCPI_33310 [Streptomyces sp. NPDC001920]
MRGLVRAVCEFGSQREGAGSIGEALVEMANLVGSAMDRAADALPCWTRSPGGGGLFSAEDQIEEVQRDLGGRAIAVSAWQHPVATGHRVMDTSVRMRDVRRYRGMMMAVDVT